MQTYRYVTIWREYPKGRLETGYIQKPNLGALLSHVVLKWPDADEIIVVHTATNEMFSIDPKARLCNACAPERRPG